MDRCLKTEPKFTSFRKIEPNEDKKNWTRFVVKPDDTDCPASPPYSLESFSPGSRSPRLGDLALSPYNECEQDDDDEGTNPAEHLQRLNIYDTIHSSSSRQSDASARSDNSSSSTHSASSATSSSSAASCDSNRSEQYAPPIIPSFKRPWALRLVSRPRSSFLPPFYASSHHDDDQLTSSTRLQSVSGYFQRLHRREDPVPALGGSPPTTEAHRALTTSSSTDLDDLGLDTKKRIYECSYDGCDKIYTKSSHLKAHTRSHTGTS